ncbi:unnamed protein product [Ilex paraguariensis]|uniref:Uncharacterized protein n=1 Tax=Ilex paraguariensis TaxID=185542 RepID=A0ABC8QYN3_9AQUA
MAIGPVRVRLFTSAKRLAQVYPIKLIYVLCGTGTIRAGLKPIDTFTKGIEPLNVTILGLIVHKFNQKSGMFGFNIGLLMGPDEPIRVIGLNIGLSGPKIQPDGGPVLQHQTAAIARLGNVLKRDFRDMEIIMAEEIELAEG